MLRSRENFICCAHRWITSYLLYKCMLNFDFASCNIEILELLCGLFCICSLVSRLWYQNEQQNQFPNMARIRLSNGNQTQICLWWPWVRSLTIHISRFIIYSLICSYYFPDSWGYATFIRFIGGWYTEGNLQSNRSSVQKSMPR